MQGPVHIQSLMKGLFSTRPGLGILKIYPFLMGMAKTYPKLQAFPIVFSAANPPRNNHEQITTKPCNFYREIRTPKISLKSHLAQGRPTHCCWLTPFSDGLGCLL